MTGAEAANFLHRFLLSHDQLAAPIGRMSFGERRRLALAILVAAGSNLLLLDEPTNHLDVPSREAFESAFDTFTGAALVVTHDRYFIERFAERIVELV
jgi:ATP-binding cassette subfamily F protein 3